MRARAFAMVTVTVTVTVWFGGTGSAAAAQFGSGRWVWPLEGPRLVSRGFDPPLTPYAAGHRGADLVGVAGAEVRAAGAGRVSYAGLLAGRGVVVVVHGALRTTYEPVSASTRVGQLVATGETVGHLVAGHSGCAAACLHWGLLRADTYLDPVRLVGRTASRLLPVGSALVPPPAPPVAAAVPDVAVSAAPLRAPKRAARWSVRAWVSPSGAGMLLSLLLGIAVLRRPTPKRPGGASGVKPLPLPGATVGAAAAALVDLEQERARRRA